ncbi:MAG: hypothetical protein IJX58_05420 [Clostridia bacterium]|nr:hypothetical protein [Clostridia bacterium]
MWKYYYFYGDCPRNRFLFILGNIISFILLIFCALAIFITVVSPKGADGASQIFGYELRIIETNSMEACEETDVSEFEFGSLKKNTMIALTLVPEREDEAFDWYSSIKVGDVLTVRYTYDRQLTITHRVTSITQKDDGSGFIIKLQGDNVNSDATQLTQEIDTSETESRNYVIGKVIWKSYGAGVLVGALQRVTKALAGE